MNYLIDPLLEMDEYKEILESTRNYTFPICISGPSDSQKAHIAYAICRHLGMKGIFITYNEMHAVRMYEDLSFFMGDNAVFFPSKEIMMHDVEAKNYDSVFRRVRALDRITENSCSLVVASAEAVSHFLTPLEHFKNNTLKFNLGMKVDLKHLSCKLINMGYERVASVSGEGQFAIRGGIIDVFSVSSGHAARIELFDDEIDSIRRVDVVSQRSADMMESVKIIPARDVIYPESGKESVIKKVKMDLAVHTGKIKDKCGNEYIGHLKENIGSDMEKMANDAYFPGMDRYIPYMANEPSDITGYLGEDTIVFVDEPLRIEQRIENILLEHDEVCKSLVEKASILPLGSRSFFNYEDIKGRLAGKKIINLGTIMTGETFSKGMKSYSIASRQIGSYQGRISLLREDIINWKGKKSRIVIFAGTRGRGERLTETLRSEGIESVSYRDLTERVLPGEIIVTRGSLNKGFEYPLIGLVAVSDKEVFGPGREPKKPSRKIPGDKISLFTDLSIGDYVVHQAHGIGQYTGMEKLSVEGIKRDYLKIRYLNGDHLYIPTNQLDLIQKYIGTEGKAPRLNKLGGTDWSKTKKRVKESLKEIAGELIKLYAKRQSLKGFQFSADFVWQRQFEELFEYEETEDQLKCIEEIKRDMESMRPMDRLLCGDVGYGKTEVAIRAIFKAVMDGKQVAYLVPTTILAQQHYMNFRDRMKEFPVTVDVISRFRTASEQRKILKDLKAGNIDVLIGTHRLIQKDIQFKDIGLLVVDEEQRFGVSHKEKLKNIKPNVDVLTLTATPIPRTLHMSLVGIRDISIIEDPPDERYPVQTYVMEYNMDVVKDAIIREIGRRGQVFYLYNRVRSIDLKAAQIQEMVPQASIVVAHGQMEEKRLENIMLKFINGEYDILVCTTIIESGLDMPNVNTIIVEDADRMGLSQLYQLRGRVGRSNRLAYAYITYRKNKVIPEVAEKRLQAIKEFTELGSGFKIAMRDLEIRGAGNLLGPEQHGHMESVGYDMYVKLLEQAVRELKGEPATAEDAETAIDININAYIDDEYITDEGHKIEMYRKIASVREEQGIADIEDELVDRYGDMPKPVQNLLAIAHLRVLAREAGFSSITEKEGSAILQIASGKQVNIEVIGKLMAKYKRQMMFNAGSAPYIVYRLPGTDTEKLMENIKIVLQDIKSFEVH